MLSSIRADMESAPTVILHLLHRRTKLNIQRFSGDSWIAPTAQFHIHHTTVYLIHPRSKKRKSPALQGGTFYKSFFNVIKIVSIKKFL